VVGGVGGVGGVGMQAIKIAVINSTNV